MAKSKNLFYSLWGGCCRASQRVTLRCSAVPCVAACCSALQRVEERCSIFITIVLTLWSFLFLHQHILYCIFVLVTSYLPSHTHTHDDEHTPHTQTQTHTHTSTPFCIHTWLHTHIFTHTQAHALAHIHAHIFTHTHSHTHTHTLTYTHTYTHACKQVSKKSHLQRLCGNNMTTSPLSPSPATPPGPHTHR